MPTSPKKPVDCSELAASLAELALAHSEMGAKTLDDVVARMKNDLPEIDRDTVADAIVAFSKRAAPEPVNRDEVKARIKELKKVARRDAELRKQIDGLKSKAAKEKSPREKQVYDDRVAVLEAERDKLRKSVAAEKAAPNIEAKMEERLTKEIDDLAQQLETGEFKSKSPAEKKVYSDKIETLRAERDKLRKKIAAEKSEARTAEKLTAEIADLEQQMVAGQFKSKPEPERRVYSDKIQVLRDERAALTRGIGAIKAADNFEKRLEAQIADLHEQLRTGHITPPTPRAKRVLTERMEQLVYERDRAKHDVNRELNKLKPKGIFPTAVGEPFDEARAWLTTGEFSAVGRQGGFFAVSHPIEANRAAKFMLKAFKSPQKAHAFDMSIRPGNPNSRPRAMEYERSKLHLPDPEIASTRKRSEEMFQTDLPLTRAISKITHVPLEKVPEMFGRAYITFLNMQRVARYDGLAETLAKNGEPTAEEGRAIAAFINAATGRGNVGEFAAAAKVLNAIFFAPRYVISRFEMGYEPVRALAAQPLNPLIRAYNKATGKSVKEMEPHMWGGSIRTDKEIALEYAHYVAGVALVLSVVSQAPGVEIEVDPYSSDFGKIRIGDTRVDLLSGFQQAAVFAAKQMSTKNKSSQTGEIEQMDVDKWLKNLTRFGRTKLSPMVGTSLDLWLGEDVTGEAVKPLRSAKDAAMFAGGLIFPITWRDIYKITTTDMGVPDKVAATVMAILGAGVQIYDPLLPKAPTDRLTVPKEERDLDPNLPEKVELTTEEYADLLQAHLGALAKIEKERKKPSFLKLGKKEQSQVIDEIYRDDYEVQKDDIVESAILRIQK